MGNKNYTIPENYRYLDSIDDPMMGEVKLYKNIVSSDFIAFKSFNFLSLDVMNKALEQIEKLKAINLSHFVRLLQVETISQDYFCSSNYLVQLIFEYHPNRLKNIIKLAQRTKTLLGEDSLKYLAFVLITCVKYLLEQGRKRIDVDIQNIYLDTQLDFKYQEIEPMTKLTHFERFKLGGDACLAPEELEAIKRDENCPQTEQTLAFNIGMILLMVSSMEDYNRFYNRESLTIKPHYIQTTLDTLGFSIEYIDFLKKLLRLKPLDNLEVDPQWNNPRSCDSMRLWLKRPEAFVKKRGFESRLQTATEIQTPILAESVEIPPAYIPETVKISEVVDTTPQSRRSVTPNTQSFRFETPEKLSSMNYSNRWELLELQRRAQALVTVSKSTIKEIEAMRQRNRSYTNRMQRFMN